MAIMNVLDLSTAHLNAKDASLLTDACDLVDGEERSPVRVTSHQCGWILFLPDDRHKPSQEQCAASGFSGIFFAVLEHAYRQDCQLVNFDADGDVVDGLPVGDFA